MNNMNQNGRSMIEMLGVLAIIGVLSVGGIAGYSKAMLKYKTNKLIDQVTMLTTNIRTLYAQQKTFTGLDGIAGSVTAYDNGKTAIEMGVIPDEMIRKTTNATDPTKTDTDLKNPFAGTIILDVDNSVPGDAGENRAFIIGVNGIPKEACMAVAVSDWGSNYSSGLIGMAISNATNVYTKLQAAKNATAGTAGVIVAGNCTSKNETTSAAYCAKDLPIQVAEASAACNCNGSSCSVAFKYY